MELFVVTWTWNNDKSPNGRKDFLVKEAFDDADAILTVRRHFPPEWSKIGGNFKVKRIVFNEHNFFGL